MLVNDLRSFCQHLLIFDAASDFSHFKLTVVVFSRRRDWFWAVLCALLSHRVAREQMFNVGQRPDVADILVVITDGLSDDRNATWAEAMLTRARNINIIAVCQIFSRRCVYACGQFISLRSSTSPCQSINQSQHSAMLVAYSPMRVRWHENCGERYNGAIYRLDYCNAVLFETSSINPNSLLKTLLRV